MVAIVRKFYQLYKREFYDASPELSLVSMPANVDALIMASRAGMITAEQAVEAFTSMNKVLSGEVNKPALPQKQSPALPQLHPIMADKRRKIVLED